VQKKFCSNYDPLTLAASASAQFLLKDFDDFFRWSAFFAFEKEDDLSCFFFDGMKSVS